MKSSFKIAAIALPCALMQHAAQAEIVHLEAIMDGLQAVPQTPSQGSGHVMFQLDTDTGLLTLTLGHYENLIGHLHMAHVHGFAPPGEKANMLFMLDHTGGTAGTLSMMNGPMQLKESDIDGMLAGLTYVALHTSTFMAGEIRGQIYVVPAPAALATFALAGLTLGRRRRTA